MSIYQQSPQMSQEFQFAPSQPQTFHFGQPATTPAQPQPQPQDAKTVGFIADAIPEFVSALDKAHKATLESKMFPAGPENANTNAIIRCIIDMERPTTPKEQRDRLLLLMGPQIVRWHSEYAAAAIRFNNTNNISGSGSMNDPFVVTSGAPSSLGQVDASAARPSKKRKVVPDADLTRETFLAIVDKYRERKSFMSCMPIKAVLIDYCHAAKVDVPSKIPSKWRLIKMVLAGWKIEVPSVWTEVQNSIAELNA